MSTLFDSLTASERALLRPAPQPRRFEPMKATLMRDPFSREGWIFERKLDGIRCVAALLHLAGHDTTALTVRSRKSLLRKAISFGGRVRFLSHRNTDGEALFRDACERGLEGIIGKRVESRYQLGRRSLLVGYYDDGALHYARKVGTGFDRSTLSTLGKELRRLEISDTPFARGLDRKPAATHWVKPELVAQIGFAEWTRDGYLRQPRYLGLRDDKPPREVVRERPR